MVHKTYILVVEDEPLARMDAVAAFEDMGFLVLEAGSSNDAIDLIEANDIRMLFTDIQMPGPMDGLELSHFVRERWPSIPIVIASARVWPSKSALPDGVRFMAKPYVHSELTAIAKLI
jgi:two-component system, response regulator PdtaR